MKKCLWLFFIINTWFYYCRCGVKEIEQIDLIMFLSIVNEMGECYRSIQEALDAYSNPKNMDGCCKNCNGLVFTKSLFKKLPRYVYSFRLLYVLIMFLVCTLVVQFLWAYLLIVSFVFKCSCCAWVYLQSFSYLLIVSVTLNIKKLSVKWKKWNISDIFFSSSSIEVWKHRSRPETLALCMGQCYHFSCFKEGRFDKWHSMYRKTFKVSKSI